MLRTHDYKAANFLYTPNLQPSIPDIKDFHSQQLPVIRKDLPIQSRIVVSKLLLANESC